jgi:Flp pilus assembly protein TadB
LTTSLLPPVAVAAAVALVLMQPRGISRTTIARTRKFRRVALSRSERAWFATAALVVVAAALGGAPVACVALTATLCVWRVAAIRRQRSAAVAVTTAYPELLDLLVLTIGAGCSPRQAFAVLEEVVPVPLRPGVRVVAQATAAGERFADSITRLRDPPPAGLGQIAQPLADALALADRHGTPLPPILDRLATEAREHRRRQAEIAARQLPIRLAFPLVGCTLPSFVLLTIVPLMAGTFSSLHGLSP